MPLFAELLWGLCCGQSRLASWKAAGATIQQPVAVGAQPHGFTKLPAVSWQVLGWLLDVAADQQQQPIAAGHNCMGVWGHLQLPGSLFCWLM